jgi:hypothetical protein
MPTAPVEVRAVARYVAPPLEDEGVAQRIERLVLASVTDARRTSRRLEDEASALRAAS